MSTITVKETNYISRVRFNSGWITRQEGGRNKLKNRFNRESTYLNTLQPLKV